MEPEEGGEGSRHRPLLLLLFHLRLSHSRRLPLLCLGRVPAAPPPPHIHSHTHHLALELEEGRADCCCGESRRGEERRERLGSGSAQETVVAALVAVLRKERRRRRRRAAECEQGEGGEREKEAAAVPTANETGAPEPKRAIRPKRGGGTEILALDQGASLGWLRAARA